MAEQIEKDGKKYWKFNLPFDVGKKTRAIYNYYMRTDPETGVLAEDQWAVYPNHSTPRSLGPLLRMLQEITNANAAKVAQMPGFDDEARIITEHNRWQERLAFYEAKRQELEGIAPDEPVGTQNPVSKELGTYIVEPLFLGWYPTTTPPFSDQPGVFSETPQEQQAVMDLYTPFSLANQIAINRQVYDEAYEQFKQDLKDNAAKFFEENLPEGLSTALGVLPFVVVGAIGLGLFYRARG
jgi:hypothetical protein